MESIARVSGFEVFATSENLKVFGKRKNYLKIHNYVSGIGFNTFGMTVSVSVAGISENLGTFSLEIKKDNHLNNGGIYDNFVIFDIRDIVNSISDANGSISFTFWTQRVTLQATNSSLGFDIIEQDRLRRVIFRSGDFPFFLPQNYWRYFATPGGVVVPLAKNTDISSLFQTYPDGVIVRDPPTGVHFSPFTSQFTSQFGGGDLNLIPTMLLLDAPECAKEWELVQWTGANGFKKSYFFEIVDKQVYTTETLQLLDNERNNKYLKDVRLRKMLKVEDADYETRCYLADIVQADDVEAVNTSGTGAWNVSIFVESQTFSVGEPNTLNDVTLTINYEKYDRI